MDAAAIVAYDDDARLARAPAARGAAASTRSSCRPASSTSRASRRCRPPSASWPRRSAATPSDWQEVRALLPLQRLQRRARPHLRGDRPARRERRRGRPRRADRDRALAARRPRRARWPRPTTPRRSSGCSGCARRSAERRRVGADRARRVASRMDRARRGEVQRAWPSPAPTPPHARSSTTCSTSSRTSSSSAACRATRWRPTAPTCCSSATSCVRNGLDATTLGHAELARFLSELTAGGPQRPPVAPATIQRKTACLRSFYRHLRREEIIDHDPTAELRAPRKSQKLPQVLTPRRGRQAARRAARRRARGAARPRDARAHVRLRPARERGRRPHGRQRRPARRASCARTARAPRSA